MGYRFDMSTLYNKEKKSQGSDCTEQNTNDKAFGILACAKISQLQARQAQLVFRNHFSDSRCATISRMISKDLCVKTYQLRSRLGQSILCNSSLRLEPCHTLLSIINVGLHGPQEASEQAQRASQVGRQRRTDTREAVPSRCFNLCRCLFF